MFMTFCNKATNWSYNYDLRQLNSLKCQQKDVVPMSIFPDLDQFDFIKKRSTSVLGLLAWRNICV